MTLHWPDPDIGRCKNVRFHNCSCAFTETLRCLDYEGTDHVCSFPQFTHVCVPSTGWSTYTMTTPQPKRWVKPGDTVSQVTP